MKGGSFIIFSSDDWGWKTSKYQVSIRLARDNTVLFVSSVGFRAPTASRGDLGRIWRKLRGFCRGLQQVEPNLYVLTPLVFPFFRGGLTERFNALLLKAQVGWARLKLGLKDPFVFVFSQNWLDFVKRQKRKKLVYYCVDDQSGFAGLDAEGFRAKDQAMTRLADQVLCSSRLLYEAKKSLSEKVAYLPHGVDYRHFSRAVTDPGLTKPADAAGLKAPVLGFFGHISYDWVDVELLLHLAKKRPDWTVLLLGRYSLAPDAFSACPNLVYLGEKEFAELPSYCKVMDVGLIPFVKSPLTEHCNPLKLYEYLAAGLPVVSTDLPEVRFFRDQVEIAADPDGFVAACERALAGGAEAARRRSEAMAGATWDLRVQQIYALLGA